MKDAGLVKELRALAEVSKPGSTALLIRQAADRIENLSRRCENMRPWLPDDEIRQTERGNLEDES